MKICTLCSQLHTVACTLCRPMLHIYVYSLLLGSGSQDSWRWSWRRRQRPLCGQSLRQSPNPNLQRDVKPNVAARTNQVYWQSSWRTRSVIWLSLAPPVVFYTCCESIALKHYSDKHLSRTYNLSTPSPSFGPVPSSVGSNSAHIDLDLGSVWLYLFNEHWDTERMTFNTNWRENTRQE